MVHPRDHPWLQPEPARLHARRHSAGQHELWQQQRPACQPRDQPGKHRRHRRQPGSGAIDTQSTSNLGGTLEFKSIDPADLLREHHVAIDASGSYGSAETWRGFGRVAVGTPDGVRGFASLQYQNGNKWKGDGQQRTLMTNVKFIAPAGAINFGGLVQLFGPRRAGLPGHVA
jgi:hypothetical protein